MSLQPSCCAVYCDSHLKEHEHLENMSSKNIEVVIFLKMPVASSMLDEQTISSLNRCRSGKFHTSLITRTTHRKALCQELYSDSCTMSHPVFPLTVVGHELHVDLLGGVVDVVAIHEELQAVHGVHVLQIDVKHDGIP